MASLFAVCGKLVQMRWNNLEINVQSDVGRKRNTNQDYANVFENQQHITFAVLADGMGGHQAGDVASQ